MAVYQLGNVYYKKISLTSAEVKALVASPKELVATPGSGFIVKYHSADLKLNYGGTNVFTEAGDNFQIGYNDGAVQVSNTIETTGFIDQAADQWITSTANYDITDTSANLENKNLALKNIGGGGGEIAGNAGADNTLDVHLWYSIVEA